MQNREFNSHYKVLRTLGSGNEGIVFLCEEIQTGQIKAVKKISLYSGEPTDVLDHFIEHVQLIQTIKHPSILTYEITLLIRLTEPRRLVYT